MRKNLPTFSGNGRATQVAARVVRTNTAYVQAVKTIGVEAPELLDKIRSGILRVADAAKLARLPKHERRELLQRCNGHPLGSGELYDLLNEVRKDKRRKAAVAFARQAKNDGNIIIGDMGMLWKRLRDGAADLFLCDPPFTDMELYRGLAELAAAKLKPGGLCLAYTGQFYLPDALAAMQKHLHYWWTFAIQFSGQHCAIHARHIQNRWKPILAFTKPPVKSAPEWLSDLIDGGGRDKEHHDWGQHRSEMEYLIERLTEPGNLVVDPFCGGGSVPAAAKKLGRRWLATEIDRTTALIARKRLSDVK